MAYHPCPESEYSDTDSDYDFAFPRSPIPRQVPQKSAEDEFLESLRLAIENSDVQTVEKCLENEEFKFGIDSAFPRIDWTPLQIATHAGSVASVKFLLERGASVTVTYDANTPLITACMSHCDEKDAIREIVELLLEHGASVTATDRFGITPLMHACEAGNLPVIEKLLQLSDPEVIDSNGRTALFHAIEANQKDVVAFLLAHGVCRNVVDFKKITPKSFAEFYGYNEIVELFPKCMGTFDIPTCYLTYSRIQDVVPDLGEDSEVPAYFPDLKTILFGMDCDHLLPIFAHHKVGLEEFLSLTDAQLKELGIQLPFVRKKILRGLFLFHSRKWSKTSVPKISKDGKIDMFDLFRISASHLKHIVLLKSTFTHIRHTINLGFQLPKQKTIASCRNALHQLIGQVSSLQDRITYVSLYKEVQNHY